MFNIILFFIYIWQHRAFIMLLIYVDGIWITGNNSEHIFALIRNLGKLFLMMDLVSIHYFLGIEVSYIEEVCISSNYVCSRSLEESKVS